MPRNCRIQGSLRQLLTDGRTDEHTNVAKVYISKGSLLTILSSILEDLMASFT